MSRERPILFTGPMVRAMLDGRKTQTRRVIKPQPGPDGISDDVLPQEYGRAWRDAEGRVYRCPYGQPGDLLWVRETWRVHDAAEAEIGYRADGRVIRRLDMEDNTIWRASKGRTKWRPSIHMPKWACRLWLRVKDVRVERLMDITVEDAKAEGVEPAGQEGDSRRWRGGFRDLWDSINLKRGFGWELDPWVWVVEFERTERP